MKKILSQLSIDIFLGDRFFHSMSITPTNIKPFFTEDSLLYALDYEDLKKEELRRLPSLRNRKDMHIYLNN